MSAPHRRAVGKIWSESSLTRATAPLTPRKTGDRSGGIFGELPSRARISPSWRFWKDSVRGSGDSLFDMFVGNCGEGAPPKKVIGAPGHARLRRKRHGGLEIRLVERLASFNFRGQRHPVREGEVWARPCPVIPAHIPPHATLCPFSSPFALNPE